MKHNYKTVFLVLATILCLSSPMIHAQVQDSITVIQYKPQKTSTKDTSSSQQQTTNKIPKQHPDNFWKRVTVGGWMSFQFGSITGISVSPEAKVRIVNQLWGGLGLTYQYYRFNDWYMNTQTYVKEDFSSNTYGGRIFLRYYLASFFDNFLGNLYAHVEYEYLTYVSPYTDVPPSSGIYVDQYGNYYIKKNETIRINSIFVGGGYRQPISNRTFIDFLILFDINNSINSPYSNPIFRIGVGVNL
jgi:hypothetical protein